MCLRLRSGLQQKPAIVFLVPPFLVFSVSFPLFFLVSLLPFLDNYVVKTVLSWGLRKGVVVSKMEITTRNGATSKVSWYN